MNMHVEPKPRGPRPVRPRNMPNPLREWLERRPRPMSKVEFAEAIGCTPSYVSQLICDLNCWPNRDIARRIGVVTKGAVTPNVLAGYPPTD